MGKSTLLTHLANISTLPTTQFLDMTSVQIGMAAPREGGEQAALELVRAVAAALAATAPWWRRRYVCQRAEAIGAPRARAVRVRQWASRNSGIVNSPVSVTITGLTQAERRVGWVRDLLTIARMVRRRRCLLLIDTCEWLMFFDDVQAEQPRPGEPLGVGAWFADVLEQLLQQIPGLRVVAAGTAVPDAWRRDDIEGSRYSVQDLTAWRPADTNTYLIRRGLSVPDGLAYAITEWSQGLPAEAAWIADALTGVLSDGHTSENTADVLALLQEMQKQSSGGRQRWLRTHVLARVSDRNQRLLDAAAVLGTFTPQALHAVAFHTTGHSAAPLQDGQWFDPLRRMSCLRELPAPRGYWQLHRSTRTWLLTSVAEDDAHRTPDERRLPPLHRAAAAYYEALTDGEFSTQAAHHRFVLGEDRHVGAWTARVVEALLAGDNLALQILTDAALHAPGLKKNLPRLYADAHLTRAYLSSAHADHTAAQEHAQQALATYQEHGYPGAGKAAVLAGQAAWNRSCYDEAAAHWTTALHIGQPAPPDLLAALAEAVCRTGDLQHADEVLHQALQHAQAAKGQPRDSASPQMSTQPAPVSDSLPISQLADAVPASLRTAHLHLLVSETAARLCDWTRSAEHADLALQHADGEPHVSALAHRMHARYATYTWDLRKADRHMETGFVVARSCSDRRCIALLQLAQADLAERKARWAPPRQATSASVAAPLPTMVPAITTSPAASGLSLTKRAESAHQMGLAVRARAAAADLATELGDVRTLAQSRLEDDPAQAASLFRSMGDRLGEAHALGNQAETSRMRDDLESAMKQHLKVLGLLRTLGDRFGQAETLHSLANIAIRLPDLKAAELWASQALAISRAIADRVGEGHIMCTRAELARAKGDLKQAERCGIEALAAFRAVGDQLGQSQALSTLADTAMRRGDVPSAERRAREALALSRITGDIPGQVHALMPLAVVARLRRDVGLAEELGLEAVELSRTIEDLQGQAHALFMLSDTARVRGDVELAEERGQGSLAFYRRAGDVGGQANALIQLADTARVRGDLKSAEKRGAEGLKLARRAEDLLGQANVLAILAETARTRGDLARAEQRGSESLTLARDANDLLSQANALDALAETAHDRGDNVVAHSLFGKAATLYGDAGVPEAADLCRQRQREL
ncbi:tetratricopeptide repeat protein [Streptomyces sp. NPDC048272]|uniref:tetratricopeptide repeat protein n=1 Tax=Streptomyces sp. NPDC048272 TaxID=3154616 RepID=UPI00342DAB62